MQSPELESKRVFLVACRNETLVSEVSKVIQSHIKSATIFTALDGMEALFKADNVLPHVAIVESDLPKTDGFIVTTKLIDLKRDRSVSVIILSPVPDKENFVDQVVTGQVQFVPYGEVNTKLSLGIARALNRISLEDNSNYKLRFLADGEILFNEGDKASSVFIVKSGELHALKNTQGKQVVLGKIKAGEFVGEMAHINGEDRSATVQAMSDCELIEIPRGTLDLVLFSKPAWAKALIATLSKRLKVSNNIIMNKTE